MAGEGARPARHTRTSMSVTALPPTKYRYRRRLPHLQKEDAAVFVTFCTGGPLILPELARDLVLEHCLRECGLRPLAGEGARATPKGKGQSDFSDWPLSMPALFSPSLTQPHPRKYPQASRYFSYFDRRFRLPGNNFKNRIRRSARTGNTYHTFSGTTNATSTSI
jgi:hypothetical protein